MIAAAETFVRQFPVAGLAKRLDITPHALYAYLSGRNRPSYEHCKELVKIAAADKRFRALKLTVDDFRASKADPESTTTQPTKEIP